MTQSQKLTLFLLRVSMGWLMFYAGITKVFNPDWSAAGYLTAAKTFPTLFQWFASPEILPVINLINEWGLTLLGVSLILGIFVRLSSLLGTALMLLYYFPVLEFPLIPPHSYLVDDHIIYALVLFGVALTAGHQAWSLNSWWAKTKLAKALPFLK